MRKKIFRLLALSFAAAVSVNVHAAAPNLVANGDFELGNVDFTSAYAYAPGSNTAEGQYTIRSNPYPWNGLFISAPDHTSGSGQMYVGNGSSVNGSIVWQSLTIAVVPNTTYFFESFVMNVCCSSTFPGNTPSILEFSISGQSLGTITTDLARAGTWQGLSETWDSGANTSVVLSLINRNTAAAGNDFALDDIYFGTQSTVIVPGVPEPETYALMMAGLVALACAARRRRNR